jgi:aspartyl-tRNA(Asn)/glutamyl-tRNA(Gln) amidotransferase subunit B
MQRASAYEIERQGKVYDQGGTVVQATLGWDDARQATVVQREKENAHDYRYFPEPDLLPLALPMDWVEEIRATLPELPDVKRDRLMKLGLGRVEASIMVAEQVVADYYERVLAAGADAKKASNWIINEVFARMNKAGLDPELIGETKVTPEALTSLIKLVDAGTINNNAAKKVLDAVYENGGDPSEWVKKLGLEQTRDTGAVESVVEAVIAANPGEATRFCAGEEKVVKFLMGLVMREGKGKFPADLVQQVLTDKLKARC